MARDIVLSAIVGTCGYSIATAGTGMQYQTTTGVQPACIGRKHGYSVPHQISSCMVALLTINPFKWQSPRSVTIFGSI